MQYFKRYLPFYLFYGASHTSYLLTFLPLLHSRWRILLPIAYTYLIHDRTKFQKFKPNLHRTVPISLVFPWKRVRTSDTPTRLPPIHSTSSTKTLSILHFHYLIYLYYLYYLYLSYLLTDITPGEDEHTGRVEEMEDDRGGYESPTAEKDEDDSFVDASENAHSEFAGADEEEEAEESPQQAIELSGDEESEESSEDKDYIPQSPKSPPARRSSAANKRTSSQRSPKTTAAVQGRRTSRRRNGAAPKYNE